MAVKGFQLVKTLIIAYVITAVLLLLTAFGLYRLHLSDWQVMAAVVIYLCLFHALPAVYFSKSTEKQKNVVGHGLWYFIFYRADGCRLYSYKRADMDMTALVKALIVCLLAGGAGAFATPE